MVQSPFKGVARRGGLHLVDERKGFVTCFDGWDLLRGTGTLPKECLCIQASFNSASTGKGVLRLQDV